MAVLHHGLRPRYKAPKFKSPRKRATGLLQELQNERVESNKAAKPDVWGTHFRVGDAVELIMGRENAEKNEIEKIRGVVLGISRKGLDHSVLLRDVVFGQPVERRILLHSPLLQSVKLLEENFVYKGKRKVKRAKLYFLRDRNPERTFLLFRCRNTLFFLLYHYYSAHLPFLVLFSQFSSDSSYEMVILSYKRK